MSDDRKYPPTHTLAQLQTALRTDEAWWGAITAIRAIGDYTVVTFERPRPVKRPITLLPMIGDTAPPAPPGTALVVTGEVNIRPGVIKIAAYRKG
ncbi:hypothetical protein [Blastomonas sp.]|uniref:hypothetical protein n=1 Tax=Blastomonas sp. TaxID=1909299 RepID=UPI00260E0E3E|nr:hypothetical protein [Blastomonas sp.]MDM7956609.1 hypothetical protein [Blastomonas sp.]